ncbi:hypothetical protein M2271_000330 [Streptomyces sp. LBL]|nr:hypothetical protein [Streptomyces sp. LBL]
MDSDNLLGQFLRARRGHEEQGMPVIGRRRVQARG